MSDRLTIWGEIYAEGSGNARAAEDAPPAGVDAYLQQLSTWLTLKRKPLYLAMHYVMNGWKQ